MIKDILYEAIALVVFFVGGALSSLILLRLSNNGASVIKKHILDFCLGLLGPLIFLILTEIYYNTEITYYTIICYLVGYLGVLLLFGEIRSFSIPRKLQVALSKISSRLLKPKKKAKNKAKKKRARRVSKKQNNI